MQFDIQSDIAFLHSVGVLEAMLEDRTTKRHILWGTDAYAARGPEYARDQEIEIGLITGENSGILKTRAQKAAEQQSERTRQHAEVFTPAWICRIMNDHADREWFGREEIFFRQDGEPTERVEFKKKSWKRYVDSKRLEITCGEAPYLVSRYDVSSGDPIPLPRRVGMLDRKLRAVNENADTEEDWLKWAFRAFEATYGYEFQGDNLLIARINLMMTFREALEARWQRQPTREEWRRLSRIVTWNIWQMDGLTYTLPYAKGHDLLEQTDFFSQLGFEQPEDDDKQPYSRIFLWRNTKSSTEFRKIKEGADGMKFNFIIGNPPYQDEIGDSGNKTYATPIYNKFMDSAYEISDKVELIHPARFLFNAGSTPKQWNQKMLSDKHFTVIYYEPVSSRVFSNTEIKGGIAITYHDKTKDYGAIETFTPYPELNSILKKVRPVMGSNNLGKIVVNSYSYHFTDALHRDFPEAEKVLSKGHAYDLKSNVIEKLPQVFHKEKPKDGEYIQIYGRVQNTRVFMFIKSAYINNVVNLWKYKVFLPAASGNGGLGEELASPLVMGPGVGSTETFCSIGSFTTELEAQNALKYIKGKFSRALLSILKVTQHITPDKFGYVPLQVFTPSSDIDWSVSIPEIDRQLYAKYGLDEDEIAFIESHVKEMV
ncbi:MAG: Eco57I restriction-modification methylase domain-containing protein [Clostridia bacterium]|nr:Eco57I restriction-modification methylase domain-containing protein [Clostridia bacterium]